MVLPLVSQLEPAQATTKVIAEQPVAVSVTVLWHSKQGSEVIAMIIDATQ